MYLPKGRRIPAASVLAVLFATACRDSASPVAPEENPDLAKTTTSSGVAAQVWMTTPDQSQLLAPQASVKFGSDRGSAALTIDVDENTRYQAITGFGAAVTGSAAYVIQGMPVAERAGLMDRLFHAEKGIGLSLVRVSMGATDFSLSSYTYNDLPSGQTDPDLAKFSIEPDRKEILPVLQHAKSANPGLQFIASPWSAPAWMKTSGSLNGGKLKPEVYGSYANYFRKFVDAYAAEGIRIYAVTVQNEPHHEAPYPSMRMEAGEQAAFVKDHLGPTLNGTGAKILAFDHNWDNPDYPIAVLNDAAAKQYIAGSAFHCYAGDVSAQTKVRDAHPSKDIYFTECSGGEWATDFGSNLSWNVRNLVIGATRNWAKSVLLWNLALNPQHGPQNGGCTNCRGVVAVGDGGSVAYNVEYYALGHISKFVKPGAQRIASNTFGSESVENVTFRNPDGSKVMVALNSASSDKTFKVRWNRHAFNYTLRPGAVATFRWP